MIAKCGDDRVHHWAHKGRRQCDPWWEETEWHLGWKGQFPAEWQEIIQLTETGERHIADVKTDRGWVIEFQHSPVEPEERRSREAFYKRLIWVVDGTGKRNSAQLIRTWNESARVGGHASVRRAFSGDCGLLQKWAGSKPPIFFDLGEPNPLLWLFDKNANGSAYLYALSRAQFIGWHRIMTTEAARRFDEFVTDELPKLIEVYESQRQAQPSGWDPLQPRRPRRSFRF
jgi:hypothetical protein